MEEIGPQRGFDEMENPAQGSVMVKAGNGIELFAQEVLVNLKGPEAPAVGSFQVGHDQLGEIRMVGPPEAAQKLPPALAAEVPRRGNEPVHGAVLEALERG